MSYVNPGGEALFELTASAILTLPPAMNFEAALKEAIFGQPWAEKYPSSAQHLYDYLISNPELVDLLHRFPGEVSADELIAKVQELAGDLIDTEIADPLSELAAGASGDPYAFEEAVWQFIVQKWLEVTDTVPPDEIVSLYDSEIRNNTDLKKDFITPFYAGDEKISWEMVTGAIIARASDARFFPSLQFDLSLLTTDIPTLYQLLEWKPKAAEEQAAVSALKTLLDPKNTPETIHIGDQVVPVPFRDQFVVFLTKMEERQARLEQLWKDYFGEEGEDENWRAKAFKWLNEHVFTQENVEAVLQFFLDSHSFGYVIDVTKLEWEYLVEPVVGEDAANNVLAKLGTVVYNISQIGTNFQQALIDDPLNALAGMALAMAGTATGAFLLLDVYFYVTEPELGWGNWRCDTGGFAFQAGMAIGEFGMGVAQTIVATPVAVNSNPSIGLKSFTVTVPKWLPGANVVAQMKAVVPFVVVQDMAAFSVAGLGMYGAGMAMTGTPPEDNDSDTEETSESPKAYQYDIGYDELSELPSDPQELINNGWTDVTPSQVRELGLGRLELENPRTGMRVLYHPGETGSSGWAKNDHYHVFNPNSTGNRDLYLDIDGNPVPRNSRSSHILAK